MNKKKFVRAEEGKPPGISVIYYDTDGNMTIRYHDKNGKIGSIAWRNNNHVVEKPIARLPPS